MIKITENVYQLEDLRVGQIYLLEEKEDLTLIDTGMIGDFPQIKKQLHEKAYGFNDIKKIIITHGHIDHRANLKKILSLSGAEVFAHREEISKISGKIRPLKIKSLGDGQVLDILGGLEIIHIPGHTPGNIALYNPERRILFAGDCLFNDKGFRFPPKLYNKNNIQFRENVSKLLRFEVDYICMGHGPTVCSDAQNLLKNLIEKELKSEQTS